MEIKSRTGSVLYSSETAKTVRQIVEEAVKAGADLTGAYLAGAYLRGAVLTGAVLTGAVLRGAVLGGADLTHADLGGADLGGADLTDAVLRGAVLTGAVLTDADLTGADLRGAVLRDADLTHADLRGAVLRGAVLTGAAYGVASMERPPILVNGLRWPVMIFDSHIKIGCELHTISEWIAFSDEEISKMDKEALDFWAQWKETLCAVAVADGRS